MDIAEQSGYAATVGRTGYYATGWKGNQYVKTLGVAKGLGYVFFGGSLVLDGAMYFTGQQSGGKTLLSMGVNTTSLIIGGIPGILIGGGYLYVDKVLLPDMQRNPEHWSKASDTWTLYGFNCFVEGSKISMDEGTFKNIEDVQIGDSVLTYNFVNKHLERNCVLEIATPIHNKFVKITFSNGEEVISTEDHPYYVKGKGWSSFNPDLTSLNYGIKTEKIEASDLCFTIKRGKLKRIKITQIIQLDKSIRTYNLSKISNSDNYFVNGILVNNESKTGLNINK